jgi:hypothetical protein
MSGRRKESQNLFIAPRRQDAKKGNTTNELRMRAKTAKLNLCFGFSRDLSGVAVNRNIYGFSLRLCVLARCMGFRF